MAAPSIYNYPLHDTAGIIRRDTGLTHLRNPSLWRTALPLYRRLRFGRFEHGHLFTNLDLRVGENPSGNKLWFYAFVDRSCRPETEVWFFGSWDAQNETDDAVVADDTSEIVEGFTITSRRALRRAARNGENDGFVSDGADSDDFDENDNYVGPGALPTNTEPWNTWEAKADQDELMLALVKAIKDLDVPTSMHQDILDAKAAEPEKSSVQKDHSGLDRDEYGGHMLDPNIMLWGAVHERTVPVLQRLGLLSEASKATAVPNYTFIFDVKNLPQPTDLPKSLRWGTVKPEHFSLVRSRTQIPRQDRTLAILPSLAIYAEGKEEPVSWAFVGLDSSLTTLHVEPEWRRRGLAQMLTTKLLKERMRRFHEEGQEKLGIGYVIKGNEASRRMCESLGARSDWEVYWLRVDLTKVEHSSSSEVMGKLAVAHKRKRSSNGSAANGELKQARHEEYNHNTAGWATETI